MFGIYIFGIVIGLFVGTLVGMGMGASMEIEDDDDESEEF